MNEAATARTGETGAPDTWYRAHAQKLFCTVRRITRNHEDAEDTVQDAFLRAFLHLQSFDGRSTFSTWLTRIGINSALMILRKRRNSREVPAQNSNESDALWEITDSAPDPEKQYLEKERAELVRKAITNLRLSIRRPLELHKLHGYSLEEMAAEIGVSVPAAKGRLHHARAALRKSKVLRNISDRHRPPAVLESAESTAATKEGEQESNGGEMSGTYKAIEVSKTGQFSEVSKPLLDPAPGYVRIRIEACGVCHSDSATVEGLFPIDFPRVPGHEVVGRIDALGSGVQGWAVGQRVGVGFLAGFCGYCEFCRSGDLVNCRNQEYTGIHYDGGYAEVMIAKASGLVSIPDDLSSTDAAPLLCAGLTTFSALRNSPAKAGDLVAVLGIGGLGHLGVQYAKHMGFEVVAIDRGTGTTELAKKLGAHHYIDSSATDPAAALHALGGATVILITASGGKTVAATFKGLRPGGVSIVLGVGPEPVQVDGMDLIFATRKVEGALTGTPRVGDITLRFSVLSGASAMIETVPLEQAAAAYAKMMAGKARFRMVLVTKNGAAPSAR